MSTEKSEQTPGEEKTEARPRWIPGTQILYPRVAYDRHCESYTYRLSELVFGSLLASYILGFFVFGMNVSGGLATWKSYSELLSSMKLIQMLQYLSISLTFSYLTAGYYVTYHNSILTMPQIPPHKLGTDFGIALLQAILFGLSMVRPEAFLFCMGISLATVLLRQQAVFEDLTMLFDRVKEQKKKKDAEVDRTKEGKLLLGILKNLNREESFSECLQGWLPPERRMWGFVSLLLIFGFLSESRHYTVLGKELLPQSNLTMAWIQAIIYLSVFAAVWKGTMGVFTKGAEHRFSENDTSRFAIDYAAEAIVEKLQNKK